MLKIEKTFLKFIENPQFPCMGAKAAAKKKQITFITAQDLNSAADDVLILSKIYQFIENWGVKKNLLQTLVVIFENPKKSTELEFENNMWARLQGLHNLDNEIYEWDKTTSHDVSNPMFSFSLGGHCFFIVGLHPQSSRKARQFVRPALVFNLHEQFEKLRREGVFDRMRDKIREKDCKFSGSINPMVKDYGDVSEAIQYSGRKVSANYSCPFKPMKKTQKKWSTIAPCSGNGFILKKNQLLIVEGVFGEQVADLFCFSLSNKDEFLSSGKSMHFNRQLLFSTNDILFSNESNPMLTIIHDEVKNYDSLYSRCGFRINYKSQNLPDCYEHLSQALKKYEIEQEKITTTFNMFMNVSLKPATGVREVLPPLSKTGDKIIFKSHMDLIVGLTACSAEQANHFSGDPIRFKIVN